MAETHARSALPTQMQTQDATNECDVLVIGGGPGGSTVGTLLARRGIKVAVLDKDRHPRFHIGESLLPANMPLLRELGVADEVSRIGMRKPGIEFVSPHHQHPTLLDFADSWDKSLDHAYHVLRSEFDHVLLNNAQRSGADVHQGCRVKEVDFLPDGAGVTARSVRDDGTEQCWKARFLVDASGRDTFLANKFKLKIRNRNHNSSALYGHFEGVKRLEGPIEGNISIFWFEHGWFWFIPLNDGLTSIGAVCWPYYLKTRGGRSLDQFLRDTIDLCPPLAERLVGARQALPAHATGNYAYSSSRGHGENYLMVGDAFSFIDPVFSSGVFLAMKSAFAATDVIGEYLAHPASAHPESTLRESTYPASTRRAMRRYEQELRRGPRDFSWYIYRVTNPTMRELFMHPRNVLRMKEALLSLLGGDIYGNSPIGPSLLAFKAVYYGNSIRHLPRTWRAWRRRRVNIQDPQAA